MTTALDAANYFLMLDDSNEGSEGISNLKLQKLVYYAQGFHMAITGTPLFEEEIKAWTHGPVVPELYYAFKEHEKNPIPYVETSLSITEEESGLLEEVHEVMGQYSAWTLRNMTHEEAPWLAHEALAGVIPKPELKEYFLTRIN